MSEKLIAGLTAALEKAAAHVRPTCDELYNELTAALASAKQAGTPSSKWAAAGEPDPHGDTYSCERAELALGEYTDDELANAVFMHDHRSFDIAATMRGEPGSVVLLTAAKERIRWLSRKLEEAKSGVVPAADGGERGAFLSWVADRLVHVHGENPNVDFVLALRRYAKQPASTDQVQQPFVLVKPTPEMIEALKERLVVTSRGTLLNPGPALEAALAAAYTKACSTCGDTACDPAVEFLSPCPDCAAAPQVPAGITVERDLFGAIHIKLGEFDFVQIQYQHPYTDNAGTSELARKIVSLLSSSAASDVLAERLRQISAEGFTLAHDDAHGDGELADAAACYALWASGYHPGRFRKFWPWSADWMKSAGDRGNLVKAGALIIAEIERLDRQRGRV